PDAWYRQPADGDRKPRIEEVLERGKPIVVQVVKEPEAQKGASLTTNLSFAGRYLVFTPFDDSRGVSRKVEDEDARRRLKDQVHKLEIPDGAGIIVRTAAIDQTKTSLARDLAALLRLWKRVGTEARTGKGVQLIYSDQDLVLQALRDYLDPAIEEILIDDDDAFGRAEEYLKTFLPRGGNRLVRYTEREPLFSRHGLEPQIDDIHQRRVFLPSGGSIVIDRTEALTAIDVNSGRSTKAATQEQTALETNLEAAVAVARQLRLRDIGGLVVVDFIDMRASRNQKRVEKELREAMKADKARSSVGRISENGLLEINRQRIHQALSLRTHRTCPSCDGTGRVPSPEMIGLNLLRRIEARAATAALEKVRIALAPELAETFQNARRGDLAALEQEFGMRVEIVASPRLNLREQEVEWFKRENGDARPAVSPVVVPVRVSQVTPEGDRRAAEANVAVAAEAATGSGEEGEEDGGGRRKRRRRRRRKRGGGGTAEEDRESRAQSADEPSRDGDTTATASDGDDDEAAGFDGERGDGDRAADHDETTAAAEAPADGVVGDTETAAPSPRRAPRSRAAAATTAPTADEGESATTEAEPTAKPARPRGRRKSAEAAADGESHPEPAEDPRGAADESPAGTASDGDDETTASPRARRSRGRGRKTAADEADAEDSEASGRPGGEEPATGVTPDDGEDDDDRQPPFDDQPPGGAGNGRGADGSGVASGRTTPPGGRAKGGGPAARHGRGRSQEPPDFAEDFPEEEKSLLPSPPPRKAGPPIRTNDVLSIPADELPTAAPEAKGSRPAEGGGGERSKRRRRGGRRRRSGGGDRSASGDGRRDR
ncbi:MAG TPA: Rne/Rng family ribonuclease, partial [Thermoanaerobaculia bacterium]|nr:Rne/Rng family ribonuclease [Thermoanaerobaculia bacterium]